MEVIGGFFDREIYDSHGIKQAPMYRKVVAISYGFEKRFDELLDNDDIEVLDREGNWHTIKKMDYFSEKI